MSKAGTYRLGADIGDDEDLRDRQVRRVDDAYVREAVSEAHPGPRSRPAVAVAVGGVAAAARPDQP